VIPIKEIFISNILAAMESSPGSSQLQCLKDALYLHMRGLAVCSEAGGAQLAVQDCVNQRAGQMFFVAGPPLAAK
jgi:hypothetical protein